MESSIHYHFSFDVPQTRDRRYSLTLYGLSIRISLDTKIAWQTVHIWFLSEKSCILELIRSNFHLLKYTIIQGDNPNTSIH